MKKTRIVRATLLALLLCLTMTAYGADTVLISSITAETPSLLLAPDTRWEIITYITPQNATNQAINWESSDVKIAEVNDLGVVSAKAVGNCSVTGTAADGSGKKITIPVQVKEHDIVILEPGDAEVNIALEDGEGMAMGVSSSGAFYDEYKTTTESEKGCVVRSSNTTLRPVKAGSDILHIREVHNKKTTRDDKYTVFVAQSAVREAGAVPMGGEGGEVLFRDIPWGSTFTEVRTLFSERSEKLKPLIVRKKMLWTQIEGEVTFGNFTAYNNGLSFSCDHIDEKDPEKCADDCFFVMGDYYFDPEISFSALKQNLIRVYGLPPKGTVNTDTECVWEMGNVTIRMKSTQKYTQVKITREE